MTGKTKAEGQRLPNEYYFRGNRYLELKVFIFKRKWKNGVIYGEKIL